MNNLWMYFWFGVRHVHKDIGQKINDDIDFDESTRYLFFEHPEDLI